MRSSAADVASPQRPGQLKPSCPRQGRSWHGSNRRRPEFRSRPRSAVLTQIAVYCGIPVGVDCFRIAKTVLGEGKKA